MTKRYIWVFLLVGNFFFSSATYAQKSAPKKRPTVGVVLSGGGAKGFAHVPVLQLIDSLGIPVDYVAGTSMGALVGGLYAIGYTPDQLEELLLSENWNEILDDTPPRQDIPIWEKDLKQKRLVAVGLDLREKAGSEKSMQLLLPSGLIQGQNVFSKFLELTRGFHAQQSFKTFPREFICVGADLKTGEEIVYRSGSLPDAMRGTMSIPTMFAPHQYDGEVVVDGGAVNNLPADHLKALGCDIIIGVNVSTPFSHVEDNPSIGDILGQTGMFIDSKTADDRKALCDVLIEPDIYDFGVTSFSSTVEILQRGKDAAKKATPALVEIAKRVQPAVDKYIPAYEFPDSIQICDVTIDGLNQLTRKYVLSKFDLPETGKVAISHLETRNEALYSSGTVEQSHFYLYPTDDGDYYHCRIKIIEKEAPTKIGLGIHYDSYLKTSILFNIDASHVLFKESRFLADFVVSERPRINATYLVDGGRRFGIGIDFNAHLNNLDLYDEHRDFIGRYSLLDGDISLYGFAAKEVASVIKVGAEINTFSYDLDEITSFEMFGIPDDEELKFSHGGPFFHFRMDRLDDAHVPTKGTLLDIKSNYAFPLTDESFGDIINSSFISAKLRWKKPWKLSRYFTAITDIHLGENLLNRPSPGFLFTIGGVGDYFYNNQSPFYGLRYLEKNIPQSMATAAIDIRYQVAHSLFVSTVVNVGAYNPIWDDYNTINYLSGIGFKFLLTTPVGPLNFTLHSPLDDFDIYGYLSFGYTF